MSESRRSFLTVCAASSLATTSGCLVSLRNSREIGDPPTESDCPANDKFDRIVCSSEDADPDEMALRIVESESTLGSKQLMFRFRLKNTSNRSFDMNPHQWIVWKRVRGKWYSIFPGLIKQRGGELGRGESTDWLLIVDNGREVANYRGPRGSSPWGTTLSGLGGGEYAVTTSGTLGNRRIRFGRTFSMGFDPVELESIEWVSDVKRDGTEAFVDVDPPWDGRDAVVRLERTDEPVDRRVVPEQAIRRWDYRTTLPYFEEGTTAVEVTAPNNGNSLFTASEAFVLGYEGSAFLVSTDSGWP